MSIGDWNGEGVLPLSAIFDSLSVDGETRGRAFVREVCQWLHARGTHLQLQLVESLKLRDVVVTFKMRNRVSLVITGYPEHGLPGEVTVTATEGEFPRLLVRYSESPSVAPYDFCTMDYSREGTAVVVDVEGQKRSGTLVVVSTIGTAQNCRVRLDNGRHITATYECIEWPEAKQT